MRRICLLLLLIGLAGGARAEINANAFETITVTTSAAVGPSASKYVARSAIGRGGTTSMFCTVETDSIRFEVDGSSPTATVGHKIAADTAFNITGYDNVRAIRFFGSGTATAKVSCTFEF